MKKFIAIILLSVVLLCATAACAVAETAEQRIVNMATAHEKVTAAECIIYNRTCLLAIRAEKFTTKSDYDAFTEELSEQIKSECEIDNVAITRSPKVMYKIAQLNKLSEEERNKAIEDLIDRFLNNNERPVKPIMPRMLKAD